jgi:uncharacterized Zn-finger protein
MFIFPFSYFLGSRFGIKDGRFRIRDTKKWSDPIPGSGINISDPQHWLLKFYFLLLLRYLNILPVLISCRHRRLQHGLLPLRLVKCEACNKQFRNLERHNREFHPENASQQCDICSKAFLRPSQLRAHKINVHGQLPDVCSICDTEVKNLSQHLVTVHETPPVRLACDVPGCQTTFAAPSHKRAHMASVHQGLRFRCDLCGKEVSSLSAHRRAMHAGPPTHVCPICIKSFRTAAHLRNETGTRFCGMYSTNIVLHSYQLPVPVLIC